MAQIFKEKNLICMKPRLYKFQSLWYCRSTAYRLGGLGFTPREAYAEWVKRNTSNVIKKGA